MVDVVILTVIAPELQAMLKALGSTKRWKDEDGTVYHRGSLRSTVVKRPYSIAVVCIGSAGNPGAAAMAATAIQRHSPKVVFLLGIAGGLSGKTKIGEAIFSDRVVAYEPAALTRKRKVSTVEPRPDSVSPDHSIIQDLVTWLADEGHVSRANVRFGRAGTKVPKAKKGQAPKFKKHVAKVVLPRGATIASGEKLFRDPTALRGLREIHGKIELVEMEAAGIVAACKLAKVPWLVVRGISDFGSSFKDDRFHEYASAAASAALAEFITTGLQLEAAPETRPAMAISEYLKRIRETLTGTGAFLDRTAIKPSLGTVQISERPPGFVPSNGDVWFLSGWSGQGKSTALKLIAKCALASSPPRVPIFVSAEDPVADAVDLLRRALGVSKEMPEPAILEWFGDTPTVILIDDWHRASDSRRSLLESLIRELRTRPTAIVVAGVSTVAAPHIEGIHSLSLTRYTAGERDELIRHALGGQADIPRWLGRQLPSTMEDLLREPVLLAKFLDMVSRTPFGGLQVPQNVPELFGVLLATLLSSSTTTGQRRADVVSAVCADLAIGTTPISLSRIADGLALCHLNEEAARFAEELCLAGIWRRQGGAFVFEHEIWRTYFDSIRKNTAGEWSTDALVRQWISTAPLVELRSMLPFATGIISDPHLQDALYDALLERDVEFYLRSLRNRTTVRTEEHGPSGHSDLARYCLDQIRRGYLRLVDTCVAPLKSTLVPWRLGTGAEEAAGKKVVLMGSADKESLRYAFGFAPLDVPDVVVENFDLRSEARPRYAPVNGLVTNMIRIGDHMRPDSGRVVAAQLLLKQLEDGCDKGLLPNIGWIGRDRFRSGIEKLGSSGFLGPDWHKKSVSNLCGWASNLLATAKDKDATHVFFIEQPWRPFEVAAIKEILDIGNELRKQGHGSTSVWNVGLPCPDLQGRGGWFSSGYSAAQKSKRARLLYRAVTETYREICEAYFPGLKSRFRYAQFPCRAVLQISDDTTHVPALIGHRWQVVATWDEALEPAVVPGSERFDTDRLAEQFRADCERLGRPYLSYTCGYGVGDWAPWDAAVTNEVTRLLKGDLETVRYWLGGAR